MTIPLPPDDTPDEVRPEIVLFHDEPTTHEREPLDPPILSSGDDVRVPMTWKCLASQVLDTWAPTFRLSILLVVVIAGGMTWIAVLVRTGASGAGVSSAGLLMLFMAALVTARIAMKVDTRRGM